MYRKSFSDDGDDPLSHLVYLLNDVYVIYPINSY